MVPNRGTFDPEMVLALGSHRVPNQSRKPENTTIRTCHTFASGRLAEPMLARSAATRLLLELVK